MESPSTGVQLQPRDGNGGTFLRSRHDCSSIGNSACHGPTLTSILRSVDAAGPPAEYAGFSIRESGQYTEGPVGEYATTIYGFVPRTRFCSDRPYGCGGTYHRHRGHCTDQMCPRRMSPQKIKKEEACVTEMLAGDQIEPSDSPWSAPVVLVTKKDSGTRFCVDYRRLKLATVKDAYPIPRIDDTLDMLAGKRWFSTLDLASGYWQVSLSPEARCKTAFATHSGLFQFRVTHRPHSNA